MTELPTWGLRASLSLALMACFSTSHNLNTAEINLGRNKFYTPLNLYNNNNISYVPGRLS